MSFFSEDSASAAAPFSGDGSVFDHPDVLLQSPMTNERVVDTQSGFLLVIKRMGERLALSCKRRVGTPPSSAIVLTPDESVKLSRILTSSVIGLDEPADDSAVRMGVGGRRRPGTTGPSINRNPGFLRKLTKPAVIVSVVVVGVALAASSFYVGKQTGGHEATTRVSDPLTAEKVDKFSRQFVSDMLDFNPLTYKQSQVQAMSYMAPDLMEKYWKETNFPLSKKQLNALPQGTTVLIEKIGQERGPGNTATADIYAQLVRSDAKLASPVHIKLHLGVTADGAISVVQQEDLTAAATSQQAGQ